MASLEERRWEGDADGLTRRDRRPCTYTVYRPDRLTGRRFVLDGDVAADVGDAEAALLKLDASAAALAGTEALARLLLRAESVASSRIEGLEVGGRRLLRADAARQLGEASRDVTALEVLGNIDAMVWGVDTVEPGGTITDHTLLEAHRRLLAGTRLENHGGRLRTLQNWIGGSAYNPCSAEFVPPPAEAVAALLGDLLAFCNSDALPALAQAAIAHAQFETIHPFVDGNGRTGRVLIHLILRRRGLGLRVVPPVSLVLATWSQDYIGGLTGTRHVGPPDSAEAHAGTNRWIALFASACRRAVEDATRFEAQVRALQASWVERAGRPRRDSAARRLIEALPAAPILTTSTAATLIDRSFQAAGQAIDRLLGAGVLAQANVGRRNRTFEAPELIEAFTALERQLASPEGDTRVSEPARRGRAGGRVDGRTQPEKGRRRLDDRGTEGVGQEKPVTEAIDKLMAGLDDARAYMHGDRVGFAVHEIEVPCPDVVAIRGKTGLSQPAFARSIGIPLGTLKNWEQGRRRPEGPARVLLALIDKRPSIVQDELGR